VTKTAQVELNSGRVSVPALQWSSNLVRFLHPAALRVLSRAPLTWRAVSARHSDTANQGLTLVHFSAQRKRFLWDRGGI
jgi:hypothetical protein